MQNPIVKIIIMVFAGLALCVFQVAASRVVVKKMFFTPKVEKPAEEEKEEFGEIYTIDDLVINPAKSGGRRHLLVSLGLEYFPDEKKGGAKEGEPTGLAAELQMREPQIRDNLITLLAGQDITVLSDIKYREKIRQSLLKAINYYLQEGQVAKLYFTKYVFQ